MGCHSAEHQRYNRFARDVGVSEDLVAEHLVLTPDTKVGDLMLNAMSQDSGKEWFGAPPPDLTLIARAKGADYLYTFLRAFYVDESRPTGVNNAAFPATAMPHVLWELQGLQNAVHETQTDSNGTPHEVIAGFELTQAGALTADEFDNAMSDLVNFLVYIAEPIQMERKRIGFWVLLYTVLAFVVFYLLKREYWRDIH
jgi:ubiquinol-cytochrome c reductase cytochrome c1 subunit